MKQSSALTLLFVAICGLGCDAPALRVELGALDVEAGVTAPGLLDEVRTFIAVLLPRDADGCAVRINKSPAALAADRAALGSAAASQAVARDPTLAPSSPAHAFGRVALGDSTFLLLASTRPYVDYVGVDRPEPLEVAAGSVIAVGCRDVDAVPAGARYDLRVALFPAGLR